MYFSVNGKFTVTLIKSWRKFSQRRVKLQFVVRTTPWQRAPGPEKCTKCDCVAFLVKTKFFVRLCCEIFHIITFYIVPRCLDNNKKTNRLLDYWDSPNKLSNIIWLSAQYKSIILSYQVKHNIILLVIRIHSWIDIENSTMYSWRHIIYSIQWLNTDSRYESAHESYRITNRK